MHIYICIRFHSTGVEPHCIVHSLPTDVALGRLANLGQARRATAVATRYKNVIGWSFQADLALPLLLELSDATLHPGKLCLHHDILLLACATGGHHLHRLKLLELFYGEFVESMALQLRLVLLHNTLLALFTLELARRVHQRVFLVVAVSLHGTELALYLPLKDSQPIFPL